MARSREDIERDIQWARQDLQRALDFYNGRLREAEPYNNEAKSLQYRQNNNDLLSSLGMGGIGAAYVGHMIKDDAKKAYDDEKRKIDARIALLQDELNDLDPIVIQRKEEEKRQEMERLAAEKRHKQERLDAEIERTRVEIVERYKSFQQQLETWKAQGVCLHCGGKIGLFRACKKCKKKVGEHIASRYVIKLGGIGWRILSIENGKMLLISEYVLETRPYNTSHHGSALEKWEQCTLREYLNDEFCNELFGVSKSAIADTHNSNPNNSWFGTSGGNRTTDKIFLLSIDELIKYFGDSGDLQSIRKKTPYGKLNANGRFLYDQYNSVRVATDTNGTAAQWWLRSSGNIGRAAYVDNSGYVNIYGNDYSDVESGRWINDVRVVGGGVRPALWLNL
jgi:hypothetical protein